MSPAAEVFENAALETRRDVHFCFCVYRFMVHMHVLLTDVFVLI